MPNPLDRDFYMIVSRCSSGDLLSTERCLSDMTEWQIAADIVSGQVTDVLYVLCFNPVEGSSRDVSEDIANIVMNRQLDDDGAIADSIRPFLENHIGCLGVAEAERECAA